MLYFDHSTSASDDDKIVALRIEHGGAAVDAYWAVIELMHRDETDFTCPRELIRCGSVPGGNQVGTQSVPTRYRVAFASLAHRLLIEKETLGEYIGSMVDVGLLQDVTGDSERENGLVTLRSKRAEENIADYRKRVETARRNGRRNGRKTKNEPTANQVGTESVTKSVPSRSPTAELSKSKSKSKIIERDKRETRPAAPSKTTETNRIDPGFTPPTRDEVRAYFETNFLRGDPDRFFDTYESQGWVKGNGLPIASWQSQAKLWHSGQVERDAERSAKGEPSAEEARWKPAKGYDPDAEYERQRREYAAKYGDAALAEFERSMSGADR